MAGGGERKGALSAEMEGSRDPHIKSSSLLHLPLQAECSHCFAGDEKRQADRQILHLEACSSTLGGWHFSQKKLTEEANGIAELPIS